MATAEPFDAGTFFGQEQLGPALADFEALRSLLTRHAPPVDCRLLMGHCRDWHIPPYRVGLIYRAGQHEAIWDYFTEHQFTAGQTVSSGPGAVTEFFELAKVLEDVPFSAVGRGGKTSPATGKARKKAPPRKTRRKKKSTRRAEP